MMRKKKALVGSPIFYYLQDCRVTALGLRSKRPCCCCRRVLCRTNSCRIFVPSYGAGCILMGEFSTRLHLRDPPPSSSCQICTEGLRVAQKLAWGSRNWRGDTNGSRSRPRRTTDVMACSWSSDDAFQAGPMWLRGGHFACSQAWQCNGLVTLAAQDYPDLLQPVCVAG
jgi:hypothetical protein